MLTKGDFVNEMRLILLEHLNFKIPYPDGEAVARDFFINRLDCPECPRGKLRVCAPTVGPIPAGQPKQFHVNLGLSQIHLEWCTGDGRPFTQAQCLKGFVTLLVRDLEKLEKSLTGLPFVRTENEIIVVDPLNLATWVCVLASPSDLTTVDNFGEIRPGGVGNVVALHEVHYDCRPGTSKMYASFYKTTFNCQVIEGEGSALVCTEYNQVIKFNETITAPSTDAYDTNPASYAIHMCFYTTDFENVANRLADRIWINPDYVMPPVSDTVGTLQEAIERSQLRIKELIGREMQKGEGHSNLVFEHEIRDISHHFSPFRGKL